MKYLHQLVILSVLGILSVATLSAQEANPFAGQGYRGKTTSGKVDGHLHIGGGISNFGRKYIPLEDYDTRRKEWGLSSSFDFLLGLGYYVTDNVAVGLETGISVNANKNKDGEGYRLGDVSSAGEFWSELDSNWIAQNNLDPYYDIAQLSLTTIEVPIRVYTKLAAFGDSIKWLALQGFVGFDLAFTRATADIYVYDSWGSHYLWTKGEENFFAPAFTAGVRASLAFVGIEYSYHLGMDSLYKNWDYYKNREHRISIGFTINSAL